MTNLQKLKIMRGQKSRWHNTNRLAELREARTKACVRDILEESVKNRKYDRTLLESTGCIYSGAFPEWAVAYAKNRADKDDISINEAAMVDNWFSTMRSRGYDTDKIEYGREVYESQNPEFGMPCECVDVSVPLCNKVINENFMLDGGIEVDDLGNMTSVGVGSTYDVGVMTNGSITPAHQQIQAQSVDELVNGALKHFADLGVRYDDVEEVTCRNVDTNEDMSNMFVKPFLDMLQKM